MKKLCILTLLVAVAGMASAQSIALGLKGGLNYAQLGGTDFKDSRTGFHGGAFFQAKVSKFAIQPEVLFSAQGATFDAGPGDDIRTKIDYVNVPIILKTYLIAGLNLQLGPQFGFVMGKKLDGNGDGISKDDIKDKDISLALGAGWDLPLGLSIDARYNLGLTEITENDNLAAARNQVFQISVGYKLFKLGK
jgi:hypothetical protein